MFASLNKIIWGYIMDFSYRTAGVCSSEIRFHIEGNIVTNIVFIGGCNGNLKAISKLVDGWTVEAIEEKLLGNDCSNRGTSCADQLAKAVRAGYEKQTVK